MAAYLIAQVQIRDFEVYKRYAAMTPAIIAEYGGRILARGGAIDILEGDESSRRVVVIEFPTMAAARNFYDSSEYQAAKHIRTPIADAQFMVVQGVE